MGRERAYGIRGWLLVYVLCSIPVLLFFSAGLAGWFLDYPIGLWLTIFLVLASPLLLIVLRSSEAPRWNIAALWIASILIMQSSFRLAARRRPATVAVCSPRR